MKLVLIRHSKTTQKSDLSPYFWSLSDEGTQLANTFALDNIWNEVDLICSSNQLKALETAVPIAKEKNLPL